MSRHTVYRDEDIEVIVGYDRPLNELFCQWIEYDRDEGDETSDSLDIPLEVINGHIDPVHVAIVMPQIWREVRRHGSVSTAIMDSIISELIKEMLTQDKQHTNRTIDWTKGIPTEGI